MLVSSRDGHVASWKGVAVWTDYNLGKQVVKG